MSKNTTRLITILVLIIITLILVFIILKPFFVIITLALACAILVRPFYKKILTYTNHNESVAAGITVFVAVISIVVPLIFLTTRLFYEVIQLYSSLSEEGGRQHLVDLFVKNVGAFLNTFIPDLGEKLTGFSYTVDVYLKKILAWLIDNLGLVLSGASTFLLDFLIFVISFYYILKDGHLLRKFVQRISPL